MKMRQAIALGLLVTSSAGCSREIQSTATKQRDNSVVNERDRSGANKTPLDQNESVEDVKVTSAIRQRLQKEDVSTNAKNAKIITQNGMVTLRGPVSSKEERDLLDKIAKEVAGDVKVENHLEVASKP